MTAQWRKVIWRMCALLQHAGVLRTIGFALLVLIVFEPFICRATCLFVSASNGDQITVHPRAIATHFGDYVVESSLVAPDKDAPRTPTPLPVVCLTAHNHTALVGAILTLLCALTARFTALWYVQLLRHQPPFPLRRPPIFAAR